MRRKRRVPTEKSEVIIGRATKTGWTKSQADAYTQAIKKDPRSFTGVYIAQNARSKYSPFLKEEARNE